MTVLGKIFAILAFVFSVIWCVLTVMIYDKSTKWETVKQRWESQNQVLRAELDTVRREKDEAYKARDQLLDIGRKLREKVDPKQEKSHLDIFSNPGVELGTVGKVIGEEIKNLADARDTATEAMNGLKKQVDAQTNNTRDLNTAAKTGEQAKKYQQLEIQQLEDALKDKDKQITDLLAKNHEVQQQRVKAEIERNSLKVRNGNLEERLQDLSKQLLRLQTGPSATAGSGAKPARNPPSERMEGLVLKTDPSGLVTVSLGSDSGLSKGHTLEVFRLGPTPKYLGTLEIIRVDFKEAIGRPTKTLREPIERGDRVGSHILDS
jgi:hypothetical protein